MSYSLLYLDCSFNSFSLLPFFRLADVAELSNREKTELWERDDGDKVLKCNRKPVKITILWRWQVRILWWHYENTNAFLCRSQISVLCETDYSAHVFQPVNKFIYIWKRMYLEKSALDAVCHCLNDLIIIIMRMSMIIYMGFYVYVPVCVLVDWKACGPKKHTWSLKEGEETFRIVADHMDAL